jgi:hypothetical protein
MLPQDSITTQALASIKNRFKSKVEESADRAREAEKNLRQQRVRQIIDEYAANNQLPLYKVNSQARENNSINGSFDQKKPGVAA